MFRSILKGSLLAASFCVIAISSNAHAKSSLSMSGDMNLKETSAGAAYEASKKAGDVCPFATKGNRDSVAVADASSMGAASVRGFSTGKTTVH